MALDKTKLKELKTIALSYLNSEIEKIEKETKFLKSVLGNEADERMAGQLKLAELIEKFGYEELVKKL